MIDKNRTQPSWTMETSDTTRPLMDRMVELRACTAKSTAEDRDDAWNTMTDDLPVMSHNMSTGKETLTCGALGQVDDRCSDAHKTSHHS